MQGQRARDTCIAVNHAGTESQRYMYRKSVAESQRYMYRKSVVEGSIKEMRFKLKFFFMLFFGQIRVLGNGEINAEPPGSFVTQ
jgi:hypothetical protein